MTSEPVAILEADRRAIEATVTLTAASVEGNGAATRVSIDPEKYPNKPKHTMWYCSYVEHPRLDSAEWLKTFRRRFGVHYSKYLDAVEEVMLDGKFQEWMKQEMADVAPIEVLVLGALRVLGRTGWGCDELSESTLISKAHHRAFNEAFNEFAATTLYDEHVKHTLTKKRKLEIEDDTGERIALVGKYFARKPK
jgi:hypothetical protein